LFHIKIGYNNDQPEFEKADYNYLSGKYISGSRDYTEESKNSTALTTSLFKKKMKECPDKGMLVSLNLPYKPKFANWCI
jgi:hypothetical protein